jgi:hypothetical protein
VKIDELLNIFHFQHDVIVKCICEFLMFKHYSKMHQTSNEKIGLNSIWPIIFKHNCYLLLLCEFFFKICNHLIINSKKSTMFLLCHLKLFSIYFLVLVWKIGPFFYCIIDNTFLINLPCFSPIKLMTRAIWKGSPTCWRPFKNLVFTMLIALQLLSPLHPTHLRDTYQ